MSIGATTGDEPDYVDDADLKTLDELRGAYKDMHKAKLSLNERATVDACMAEIEVMKQQLEMTHEQMRRLIGMYSTLRAEFDNFQQQRIKELTMKVNGGSTSPEDD
jgi:division protein CdvB (Snf7/Vps24/ESCRT-III family)